MKRCDITDLLEDQCAHCLKHTLGDEHDKDPIEFTGLLAKFKENDSDVQDRV